MFLAIAAEVAAPPAVVTNPHWIRKPTGEDFARVYPDAAAAKNLSGRAIVSCTASADGSLKDCKIDQEFPPNEGFGEAAIKLAREFRMSADLGPGASLEGGHVKIPIRFLLPGGFNPSSNEFLTAKACYGQTAKLADHNPATPNAWLATLYWHMEMAKLLAPGGGSPSELEFTTSQAHAEAEAGTLQIPKGSELDSCLAKAAKK